MSTANTTLGSTIANRVARAAQKITAFNSKATQISNTLQNLPGARAKNQGTELKNAQSDLNGIDGFDETLKSIGRTVLNLDQQLISTKADNDTLRTENRRLRNQSGSGNADEIRILRERLEEKRTEIRRLRDENERLHDQARNRTPSPGNNRRILQLEQEIEILKAAKRTLKDQKQSLETEKQTLKDEKLALAQENVRLQQRVNELVSEVGLMTRCSKCQHRQNHPCAIRGGFIRFR